MPPPIGSMRITSAPIWAIVMPPSGAATKAEISTMRRSARSRFIPRIEPEAPRRRNPARSGADDERAQRARLVLDLVEPALDQVADADDAGEHAVAQHREMADAAAGHLGHQVAGAVARVAGHHLAAHHLDHLARQQLAAPVGEARTRSRSDRIPSTVAPSSLTTSAPMR